MRFCSGNELILFWQRVDGQKQSIEKMDKHNRSYHTYIQYRTSAGAHTLTNTTTVPQASTIYSTEHTCCTYSTYRTHTYTYITRGTQTLSTFHAAHAAHMNTYRHAHLQHIQYIQYILPSTIQNTRHANTYIQHLPHTCTCTHTDIHTCSTYSTYSTYCHLQYRYRT